MYAVREKPVQVNRRTTVGKLEQQYVGVRRSRVQHAIDDRLDHQRDHCFRYAYHRQQHYPDRQRKPVRFHVAQQAF